MNASNDIYEYYVDACSPRVNPTEIFDGKVYTSDGEEIALFKKYPFAGAWGRSSSLTARLDDCHALPVKVNVIYLSIVERKIYSVQICLNELEVKKVFDELNNASANTVLRFMIGMSGSGISAVWVLSDKKSVLLASPKGEEISFSRVRHFLPENVTIAEYCSQYDFGGNVKEAEYESWMKQYLFRYMVMFGIYDGAWTDIPENMQMPELCSLHDDSYDGTFDKSDDGALKIYHISGKPKRLEISWRDGTNEYASYFFFSEKAVTTLFERFYGAHPDTKTDFIIRIDIKNRKFELGLFRSGLSEPVIVPESAYEFIVFRNDFEDLRSDNYNQPQGAWIW